MVIGDSNEARQSPQKQQQIQHQHKNSVKFFYEAEIQQMISNWTFLQQPDDVTTAEDEDALLWNLPVTLPILARMLSWSELVGDVNGGINVDDGRVCRFAANDPNLMQLANTNNTMLQVKEEWCGTDQLVYRLFYTRVHVLLAAGASTASALQAWRFSQHGQSEQRTMLLAAQVLASCPEKDGLRGMVFGHPMLVKYAVKIMQST